MSANKTIEDPWIVRITTKDGEAPKYWKGPRVNSGVSMGALKQAKRFQSRQEAREAAQDAFEKKPVSNVKSRTPMRLSQAKALLVAPENLVEPAPVKAVDPENTSKRGPKSKKDEPKPALQVQREERIAAKDFEHKVQAANDQIIDAYSVVKNAKTTEPITKRLARELVARGVMVL